MTAPARRRALAVLAAAVGTTVLAQRMAPTHHMARERSGRTLAGAVPPHLGDWQEDRSVPVLEPSPDVVADLARIYRDLLNRTYVDAQGYRVMLSIAYSGDQSDGMAVHRPEVCYPAQGFELLRMRSDSLVVGNRRLPVRRLSTRLQARVEPLTYWVVNGADVVADAWQGRLQQLRSTLAGSIPDGMLVRLSSLDFDDERAFSQHDRLARALASGLDAEFEPRLFGRPGPGASPGP